MNLPDLYEPALALARQGFRIFPLPPGQKAANMPQWQKKATTNPTQIDAWWKASPTRNIGLATGGGFFVLDEDPRHGSEDAIAALELAYGGLPPTRCVRTPSGGRHRYFQVPAGTVVRNSASKIGKGLDIRGDGGYVVSSPSVLVAGEKQAAGAYVNDGVLPIAAAPQWLIDLLAAVAAEPVRWEPPAPVGATFDEMRQLLANRTGYGDHDEWLRVGMALHHETQGSAEGFELWCKWSAQWDQYPGAEAIWPRWKSFHSNVAHAVTLRSLFRDTTASHVAFPIASLAEPTSADGRPAIQLEGGELHNYAPRCEELLRDEIYVRERELVRIGGVAEMPFGSTAARRDSSQAVIVSASPEYLQRRLTQRARFFAIRGRAKYAVQVNCPKELVLNIVGQRDWPRLRRLKAIARAPFVREDGTICEAAGYDDLSSVFHIPNAEFSAVPTNPSRTDAEQALVELLRPFDEFPFATEAGRSAFAASILSEAVRSALDACPAFCYTAPTPGTGKSLLSEMPSRIVHGCGPSLRPWAESADELRKNLFASLLAGDRTIGYDNVPNGAKVRSPILCAFLTADVYSDRKLGASEVPALPNRSVVFLTGNNITPAGDLARRSIVIRLDANTDRLRERTFRVTDLRGHIATARPTLLLAALTIVRAYVVAGRPSHAVPMPSFERWSGLVRNPLLWLGMADPVATQADETDDEAAPLAEAFGLMARNALIGTNEFTASELAAASGELFSGDGLSATIAAAGCGGPTDPKRVGYWLRDFRDRIAGGWKLERVRAPGGVTKWRLRNT